MNLRKSDPSPFLQESDEEGVGGGGARGAGRGGRGDSVAAPLPPRAAPLVTIDFDGLQKRILSVPGVPVRQYANLRAGAAGMVYYLEQATLHRYSLRDRRDIAFATGGGDYDVSLDGHKLVYRAGGGGGGRGGRGGAGGGNG